MKSIRHKVTEMLQPTNTTCGYAALAMLLSHYGNKTSPQEIVKIIPVNKDEDGSEIGSISQQLATWTIEQGFNAALYSFDVQITDLEWANLTQEQVLKRLNAVKDHRDIPNLGKYWSRKYVESYIEFIKVGGQLHIQPYPKSELLYDLLQNGPLFVNICAHTLYGGGRKKYPGLRTALPDDKEGEITTHSVVVYGNSENGDFLIADPWRGQTKAGPEALLCAITAAQIECDNMVFQISR